MKQRMAPAEIRAVAARARLIHDETAVHAAVARVAAQITRDLADTDPLVLCLMTGGVIPAGLLLPKLHFPLNLDYLHATRYRGQTSGNALHWLRHPEESIQGRTVLLVDDIFDEGYTLEAVARACDQSGALMVKSFVLVEKSGACKVAYRADYVALSVPNDYVYGMGMDYKHYLRNIPGIYAVHPLDQ